MSELLAPAGSPEALIAAVRSGADAVYLGVDKFNARRNAVGFNLSELAERVRYCCVRGVRVYLALNTLVSDSEMADALTVVQAAAAAGVDAVIVQDVGLAALIRRACPDLRLHASTQMSVHSPSALKILKEMGFCRAVIARECTEGEIRELCREGKRLGIEIEAFVHGALCMSVSGQCYMSALLGGRSGNRGLCAQPCRLEYADGSHPLSLKDMSLLEQVERLKAAGVASFKIEGRMKRPEYVAAAVSAFRSVLDSGRADGELTDWLGEVFSRSGHTDGYFEGRRTADMFGHRTAEDAVSSDTLHRLHTLYRGERQSVDVDMKFTLPAGGQSCLSVTDGEHTVTVHGSKGEVAKTLPLSAERARELCAKLGSTPYRLRGFEAAIGEGLTLPAAEVNGLRRAACEGLDNARAPQPLNFELPNLTLPQSADRSVGTSARFASAEQIPSDLSGIDTVYLPVETDWALHADKLSHLREQGVTVAAELPRGLFGIEDKIKGLLTAARDSGIDTALCGNVAAVALAREAGFEVHGHFGLNVYNSYAAAEWRRLGVVRPTLSFESTLSDVAAAAIPDGQLIAYGHLPLMLLRACPMRARVGCSACEGKLIDRKRAEMPLTCRFGVAELLNSQPLWMADRRRELPCGAMLYFTTESRSQCAAVLDGWRKGAEFDGKFTRGLYYRGVL